MKKKKIWNKKKLPLDIAKAENFGMLILALSSGICGILQIYAVSGFVNVALESIHKSLLNRHLLGTLFLLLLTVAMDCLPSPHC